MLLVNILRKNKKVNLGNKWKKIKAKGKYTGYSYVANILNYWEIRWQMLQPTIIWLVFQQNLNFFYWLDYSNIIDIIQSVNGRLSHEENENCTLVIIKALEENLQLVAWMPQSPVIEKLRMIYGLTTGL